MHQISFLLSLFNFDQTSLIFYWLLHFQISTGGEWLMIKARYNVKIFIFRTFYLFVKIFLRSRLVRIHVVSSFEQKMHFRLMKALQNMTLGIRGGSSGTFFLLILNLFFLTSGWTSKGSVWWYTERTNRRHFGELGLCLSPTHIVTL